jgi:Putative DNA-binding domain
MPKSWPMSAVTLTLLELQARIGRAVLGGDIAEIAEIIEGDGLDPAARLGIYRNHAFTTLGAALTATFPVVCRLVDERFFAYTAHEYLRAHPPRSRCLVEYGADFPGFLAGFDPCKALPYLADVARFEWALHIAATVRQAPPLHMDALAAIPAERAGYVRFRLQPCVSYVTSAWPIDAIWQANQEGEVPPVDLASGGASWEIRCADEAVAWRRLDPGTFWFRTALAGGLVFAAAIAKATQMDPEFEVSVALQRMFAEGLAVDFSILPEEA